MSDHLPECDASDTDDDTIGDCICYELRSKWDEAIEAAEAMVEAVTEGPIDQPYWIDREAALTAIRALKEKT